MCLINVYLDEKSGIYRCKRCRRSLNVKPGNNFCPKCGTKIRKRGTEVDGSKKKM